MEVGESAALIDGECAGPRERCLASMLSRSGAMSSSSSRAQAPAGTRTLSPKLQLHPRRSGEGSHRSTTFAHSPTQVPAKSGGAWRASSKRSFAAKGVPKLKLRNEGKEENRSSSRCPE